MEVEFEEFFRVFLRNLIMEIINFDLKKNVLLSDKEKEAVLREVRAKLNTIIDEIVEELKEENMLRPNILKDEDMSSRVQRIIVEVLRKHFQQRVI